MQLQIFSTGWCALFFLVWVCVQSKNAAVCEEVENLNCVTLTRWLMHVWGLWEKGQSLAWEVLSQTFYVKNGRMVWPTLEQIEEKMEVSQWKYLFVPLVASRWGLQSYLVAGYMVLIGPDSLSTRLFGPNSFSQVNFWIRKNVSNSQGGPCFIWTNYC